MQWRKFTRLKAATGHSRTRRMLCCGRRKENGRSVPDVTASPGRAPPGPLPTNQMQQMPQRQGVKEPVLLQGDFRKVSGISSEIFRQIEAVENDHDPSTAAALEAVERRGEMIVRILEPRCIGGKQAVEAAQRLMSKGDARHTVQLVEIVKRPGQTLGLYIREGNGADRTDGVFISRIALESAVYNSGCLRVGDEILAVNLVDVTHMSLDDVVIIMSIPRRLVLAIRQRRGSRGASSPGPQPLSRPEQKPPPVVVIKRDLREEDLDEPDRIPRSRSSRERRTGDGREMTESRSRLGLGLNNYSPQSEQLDLYYNSRPNTISEPPSWGYKPPPPPSVITEQPKSHHFAPSHAYYQNAGTLESLAEKVHSFYPGPSRRMSAGTGVGISQSHARFPRSGSDQHLPRVEYSDYSSSLGRHSLLRSSLKSGTITGGTLGRYGRYEPPRTSKYGTPPGGPPSLTRRSRPTLDYSSDTEATIGPRPNYYYYNRPAISSIPRGTSILGGTDLAKFNSLPRDRPAPRLGGLRTRLGERLMDDSDGNLSAPELPARRDRDLRSRITASPSIFTSDEYRAWLRRAPSSSAISEQMRMTRDLLNQPRSHRFSCSAENIHDALKNTESIYSSRTGALTGTLDRHITGPRGISALPVRSMSSQHISGPSSIRSPSIRRMRQLLELSTGPAGPGSPGSILSGHQSPAPTPSATLPRTHRQIDINPAEFVKYKLDKPVLDIAGISGMLWIHLLAGRGLRSTPDVTQSQGQVRDLYCVLECDRVHKARTVVRSGDLQFDWDESFELDLVCNKQLDVLVYSWDPQHRHKLCYRGAVSLASLLRQSPLHQLALKVEPRGTIYIRLRHTDPVTLYRRRGLPSLRGGYPQLFGADLETVVNRESKGAPGSAPVPIVLRRCVEEVERRGLDIIGLYRLCGSATKKRLLREAFERNSRAVELSPEHVPDINVITGVLKDYLRELPEPLFTRCLFQMTVDALAVCLPDDPEGNAKLMLSILDCLPRANRATLVFLLDHLSLVVSASERNKMSAQALATVMGPPLMLHSSNAAPGAEIDHAQPIAVLKYLLQIWPQPQTSNSASGRRGEPIGQRGNKVSALQVDKPQQSSLPTSLLTASSHSLGQHHLLVTPSSHQYQSVVGQSVQSPRASPQVVQQPLQSEVLADSGMRDQSPRQGTPSPDSSSTSTESGSGSGTDTIKRGASPAGSISSTKERTQGSPISCYTAKKDDHDFLNNKYKESNIDKKITVKNGSNNIVSGNSSHTYGPTTTSDTFPSIRSVLPSTSAESTSSLTFSSPTTRSSVLDKQSQDKSSPLSSPVFSRYSTSTASIAQRDYSFITSSSITTSSTSSSPVHQGGRESVQYSSSSLRYGANNGDNNNGHGRMFTGSTISKQQLYSSSTTKPTPVSSQSSVISSSSDQKLTSAGSSSLIRSQVSGSSSLGTYHFPSSSIRDIYGDFTSSPISSVAASSTSVTTSVSISLPSSYTFSSSTLTTRTTASSPTSSPSPSMSSSSYKVSSPFRQVSTTSSNNNNNTLTTSVGRNLLYQSDTSYSIKNQQQQEPTISNFASSDPFSTAGIVIPSPSKSLAFLSSVTSTSHNGNNGVSSSYISTAGSSGSSGIGGINTVGGNGGSGSNGNFRSSIGGSGNGGGSYNGYYQSSSHTLGLYGTLPKTSNGSSSLYSSTASSSGTGGGYYSFSSGTDSMADSAGTSSVNVMGSGSTMSGASNGSSYDFYSGSTSRQFPSGLSSTSGNGYHTLGSYRVQYSSTNPFLESFDPPSQGDTTASGVSSQSVELTGTTSSITTKTTKGNDSKYQDDDEDEEDLK